MAERAASSTLFISHNAADRAYAQALEALVYELVGNRDLIGVRYSSSENAGPEGGEAWREWIYKQVVEARTTLIVVTPHALGKPWLLWEAGAVKGAALARLAQQPALEKRARGAAPPPPPQTAIIVSLSYGLPDRECPDPLRGEQIVQGTDIKRLQQVFRSILKGHGVDGEVLINAGKQEDAAFRRYLDTVDAAMKRAPSIVNEANVQDWLARLDALAAANRLSELAGFERWMTLAFGRESDEKSGDPGVAIDVRLHRRLGELYLGQKKFAQAARQLRQAWRAAPRDIYVLRPLAEASMKSLLEKQADGVDAADVVMREELKLLLDAIRELDAGAYTASPDAAGLLAKYYRRVVGEPAKALEVYREALKCNADSYYLADLVAQTELELGDADNARTHFRRALEIIERLNENNIWSHATAATACVGLADIDRSRRHLEQLLAIERPSRSVVDSIARGIREVAARTGVAKTQVDDLLHTLDDDGAKAG